MLKSTLNYHLHPSKQTKTCIRIVQRLPAAPAKINSFLLGGCFWETSCFEQLHGQPFTSFVYFQKLNGIHLKYK